jgi:hypothetical protein
MKKTARGFNVYGTVKDTHGTPLEIYQSSSATHDSPLWLCIRDNRHTRRVEPTGDVLHPVVHLDRKRIKKLIRALQAHLDATE